MKRIFVTVVLLLSFIITGSLFAQETLQLSDIEIINLGDGRLFGHQRDEDKTAINGKVRIITGYTTEYIDADFDNGYASGKWEYYKKNKLSSYISYNEGYMEGEFAELYFDGESKIEGSYKNGKKDGEWNEYYREGEKKQTEIFEDGGLIKKLTYYTDGSLESERNFLNGKEHGVEKKYSYEGVLKSEKNYVNGKQVGKQMQYYSSNIADYVQMSNYSENGKLEGEYTETYAETNNIKTKGQYVNGKKDGKWLYGNLKGKITKEETYTNGKLTDSKK